MWLLISDASVLIDIECGELTNALFKLPWKFVVPDVVFAEELSHRHGHLPELGLIIQTLSGQLVSDAYELRQKYAKTSLNDLLALVLAKHENCKLLTGDKALREVAELLGVEVHGTIWLLEQMLQYETILVEDARVSVEKMRTSGSRLPWFEVEKILQKF